MDLGNPGADLVGHHQAAALRTLSRQGRAITGRDVARLSQVNPSSMRRALLHLARTGLVEAHPSSHAVMYSLRREHVLWPALEQILTAMTAVRAAVVDLVGTRCGPRVTLAVFGSVARGDADADSDLDLVLIWPERADAAVREALIDDLSHLVMTMTGNPAQVLAITQADLSSMVVGADPLITSWESEAITWSGPDLLARVRQVRHAGTGVRSTLDSSSALTDAGDPLSAATPSTDSTAATTASPVRACRSAAMSS